MLRSCTPCDLDGVCPYMDSAGYVNCEWWCHDEPDEDWIPEELEFEVIDDWS